MYIPRRIKLGTSLTLSFVLLLYLSGAACSAESEMSNKQLVDAVEKLETQNQPNQRSENGRQLADLARDVNPEEIEDSTLAQIMSLLDSSDDLVRFWAAASLGNIGPRAGAAVPKLLERLLEVDCERASLNSASAIRTALEKIGTAPPPRDCA